MQSSPQLSALHSAGAVHLNPPSVQAPSLSCATAVPRCASGAALLSFFKVRLQELCVRYLMCYGGISASLVALQSLKLCFG